MKRLAVLIVLGILTSPAVAGDASPREIFNQRIMPIFRSANPSSCVQCHLSSVDLKEYILPTPEATFVSLRDQGLVDLEAPAKSKILALINMGEKDLDEGARLIHEENRDAERDAFSKWIAACCNDPQMRALPKSTSLARPHQPDEVIRHARKSRVVDSFVRNVWSQRMRCFPCHTPHEIKPADPKYEAAIKTHEKFAAQYDEKMLKRLEIFRETPEATMQYLIKASESTPEERLPMLNLADPVRSLLVLKPTSKLPAKKADGSFEPAAYNEPVSHMGGLKMHMNDQSYKSFVTWIQDYARVVKGAYQSVEELPDDNWFPSKLILRVKSVPEDWAIGSTAQLYVHEWDTSKDNWSDWPIAFTQGTVTPRRIVNGALFLLGNGDVDRENQWRENAKLAPKKRYLVRTYLDRHERIAKDPAAMLTESDFLGQIEIKKPRWREGFKFAEVLDGKKLTQP